MEKPDALRAGARLGTEKEPAIGRVAAIAFDEAGRAFGITALHVLRRAEISAAFDETNPQEHLAGDQDQDEATGNIETWDEPFHAAIGAFEIPGNQLGHSPDSGKRNPRTTANPLDHVGLELFKLGDVEAIATVTSVGGALLVEDPRTGGEQLFYDVIELVFAPGGPDPAATGEAGSLLVDAEDRAVAILIAGARDLCYAAAIEPFVAAHNLSLVPPMTEARVAASVRAAAEEILPNAADAIAGARSMRVDLELETPLQGDPSGNDVPSHLLELLNAA